MNRFLSPDFPIRECKIPDARNYFIDSSNAPSLYMLSLRPPPAPAFIISFCPGSRERSGRDSQRLVGRAGPLPQQFPRNPGLSLPAPHSHPAT